MSTFDGLVSEFPDIRVDFFRLKPGLRAPLACFLSHVHSDHLAGLESFRSPFIYCSAATREILLRLERYPCRINYARGILERRTQTYKHLGSLLKSIPLETPTMIELEPGRHLRVTLFDANHCTGAVMFLFEGNGKAVLYTGDIRSEPWHVNSIARSPCLVEYSSGTKVLDKIYLDTSFTEDVTFPLKAAGIKELLAKVGEYPQDTIFHFQAWTFGYEDVWVALAKALGSKIHLDEYKLKLYQSLRGKPNMGHDAATLAGFTLGNADHPGCLTQDVNVRLHSCEKGNYCATVRNSPNVVYIEPIITRRQDGREVAEAGIGGGGGDLEQQAELDLPSIEDIKGLLGIISMIPGFGEDVKADMIEALTNAATTQRNAGLLLDLGAFDGNSKADITLAIGSMAKSSRVLDHSVDDGGRLPRKITFPYSRHSSLPELRHLVGVFRPADVWPCTVNEREWLEKNISIHSLFGHLCASNVFDHDAWMTALASRLRGHQVDDNHDARETQNSDYIADSCTSQPAEVMGDADLGAMQAPPSQPPPRLSAAAAAAAADLARTPTTHSFEKHDAAENQNRQQPNSAQKKKAKRRNKQKKNKKRSFNDYVLGTDADNPNHVDALLLDTQEEDSSQVSATALEARRNAFLAMQGQFTGERLAPIGLLSTTDSHSTPEVELDKPAPAPAPVPILPPRKRNR